jgi:hypothetical protein
VAAFKQQPLRACKVWQAAMRHAKPGSFPAGLLAVSQQLSHSMSAAGTAATDCQPRSLLSSSIAQLAAAATAAAADAAGNQEVQQRQQQELEQQLWGLCISSIKAVACEGSLSHDSQTADMTVLQRDSSACFSRALQLYQAAGAWLPTVGAGYAGSSSSLQLMQWLVFAARCLLLMCQQLVVAAGWAVGNSESAAADSAVVEAGAAAGSATNASASGGAGAPTVISPMEVLMAVQLAADWMKEALEALTALSSSEVPAAAAAAAAAAAGQGAAAAGQEAAVAAVRPVLSKLLAQHAAVAKAMTQASPTAEKLTSQCMSTAEAMQHVGQLLGRQLLQQVQEFAGGVCGALPLRHCCNNPGCVNMDGLSEAALVAGAGSRCSRCKVCYYCSKGCQEAAWRLHKPVCKRLHAGC